MVLTLRSINLKKNDHKDVLGYNEIKKGRSI